MIEAFLIAALSLPPMDRTKEYVILKEFVEARYPGFEVVFVNEDEELLNPDAQDIRVTVVGKAFKEKGMKMYLLPRSA